MANNNEDDKFIGLANEKKAVSNTGPIIHLSEINLIKVLDIFYKIMIPKEVEKELRNNKIAVPRKIKIQELLPDFKDRVKILTNQENLDLGEKQEEDFIKGLESKLSDLNEKEISSLLKSGEKVNVREMIQTIVKEFEGLENMKIFIMQ